MRLPTATEIAQGTDDLKQLVASSNKESNIKLKGGLKINIPCEECNEHIVIPFNKDNPAGTEFVTMAVSDEPGLYCRSCFHTDFRCSQCEAGERKHGYKINFILDGEEKTAIVCDEHRDYILTRIRGNEFVTESHTTLIWEPGSYFDTAKIILNAYRNRT